MYAEAKRPLGRFLPSTCQEAIIEIGEPNTQSEGTTEEEISFSPTSSAHTKGTYHTMGDVDDDDARPTFGFPITNQQRDTILKNIPPSAFPIFYGLITEDPDTFLFEFDVL